MNPHEKEVTAALFTVANRELEGMLLDSLAKLLPVKTDTLEGIAKAFNEALADDKASTLPKAAYDKGRAYVGLIAAAAEFQRAGTRYAEMLIIQMASGK